MSVSACQRPWNCIAIAHVHTLILYCDIIVIWYYFILYYYYYIILYSIYTISHVNIVYVCSGKLNELNKI